MTTCGSDITTLPFRNTPAQLMSHFAWAWMHKYGWLLIIPLSICGALATLRWEWTIVGLVIFLLVYPFVIAMVYFSYGFKPEVQNFIRPMKVTFSQKHINFTFLKENIEDSGTEEESKSFTTVNNLLIPYTDIKKMSVGKKYLTLSLCQPLRLSFTIPDNAWGETPENTLQKEAAIEIMLKNGIEFA